MGVRVIYRTDVFHHHDANGPENFASLINNHSGGGGGGCGVASSSTPPLTASALSGPQSTSTPPPTVSATGSGLASPTDRTTHDSSLASTSGHYGGGEPSTSGIVGKPRKSERGDSFPKLRLSPKSFRFSGRFGRSKSEIEKNPTDPFYNYSKSFQEYDSAVTGCGGGGPGGGGGPQGAVDKPFLLQDGRVGLRASLDKAWYTHGEDVTVTVSIRNDSRKTVRKVRVCAIQHVDVCMFNNGKFKNIVADSDATSPVDRTVPPGGVLNTTVTLRPQRGPTKNWIALEDTLQRSTEPEEITGAIAASAIRSPHIILPAGGSAANAACQSPAVCIPFQTTAAGPSSAPSSSTNADNRNVFAIYVSYYVKVKLTLSGMGGELSLKLPFLLVHIDEQQRRATAVVTIERLALKDVPPPKKAATHPVAGRPIDRIETLDDEINLNVPSTSEAAAKRRLMRSETLAKDVDEEPEGRATCGDVETTSSDVDMEHVHMVEVHAMPEARLKEFVATAQVHAKEEGHLNAANEEDGLEVESVDATHAQGSSKEQV